MMRCQQCNRLMKERLVTDEFVGTATRVRVTGIRTGLCSQCGRQAVDSELLEEIEMFLSPILGGGIGMQMLDTPEITIDLGHSMHPSAIDIAGPSDHGRWIHSFESPASLLSGSGLELAEEAA